MPVPVPSIAAMTALRISTIPAAAGDGSAVTVVGAVDLSTADLVAAALEDLLSTGFRAVRLDVSQVTFLDCSGLGVLVQMHHRFLAAGGSLTLTGVGRPIARLLRMTGLDDVLTPVLQSAAP